MVTITSTANSSLRQLQTFNSENNNSHLRDASFSSYLNSNDDNFIEKLSESSRNLNPFNNNSMDLLHQGEKKEEDGEIGVFEAEKYFNGGMEESTRVANDGARTYQHQKDEQIAPETRKYKIQSATPSVRSESSWNSQSALLQSALRNSSRNRKKVQGKSFLASLVCKCSCSDKNSVDISDQASEINFYKTDAYGVVPGQTTPRKPFKAGLDTNHSLTVNKPRAESWINKEVYFQKPEKVGVGLNRQNSLTFVNSGLGNQLVKMQLQQEEEEKPRESLEVFGSPMLDKRIKSLSFDKRLAMPSWDAAPKIEEIDFSANSGGNYNDNESDASSDLFEIESLTSKSNPFLSRQALDANPGCATPTNGYAPSEASIEWSVVTASAAEYSVMSDCEEQRSEATIRSPIRTEFASSNGKTKASRETQRRRPSTLLGCKSHKAVSVVGDAFITHEKPSSNQQIRRKSETLPKVTRLQVQAETKLGSFSPRQRQHAYPTSPLQHSHSSHAPQLLYI